MEGIPVVRAARQPRTKGPCEGLADWGSRVGQGHAAGAGGRHAGLNQKAVNDSGGHFSSFRHGRQEEARASGGKVAVGEYLHIWQEDYYFTANTIFSMHGG